MLVFILCLVLFLVLHSIRIVTPGLRTTVIDRWGKPAWGIGYSIASTLSLVLLAWSFGEARMETGLLYVPPVWASHLTLTLMLIAMICLVAGFLPPGHIATKMKHPIVLSIKIWALSHLLANGETSAVLLFVGFLAWAVLLRISLKRRERAGELVRKPFVSARYDAIAAVIGVLLWGAMIWKVHYWLIGIQPLPF